LLDNARPHVQDFGWARAIRGNKLHSQEVMQGLRPFIRILFIPWLPDLEAGPQNPRYKLPHIVASLTLFDGLGRGVPGKVQVDDGARTLRSKNQLPCLEADRR
jgi:hypothetical protein